LAVSLGGTSYAAVTIGTNSIRDRAVSTRKVAPYAVTAAKVALNAVDTFRVRDGSLRGKDLSVFAIDESRIAHDAVTAGKLAPHVVVMGNGQLPFNTGTVRAAKTSLLRL